MAKRGKYPAHGQIFAKPIRVSKAGLAHVEVTPRVREYVARFKGRTKLDRVKAIVQDIARFEMLGLERAQAERRWGPRRAENVIRRKLVYFDKDVGSRLDRIGGCHDQAKAVLACLRALGIRAVFRREITHSDVKFEYKGKYYIADPSADPNLRVREMVKMDIDSEARSRKRGSINEGPSPAQIGLTDHSTGFFRYKNKESRKQYQ